MCRIALLCIFALFVSSCYSRPSTSTPLETADDNSTAEQPPAPTNETGSATSGEENMEENTCPNCCEHVQGCRKQNGIDHVKALGFQRNDMSDWKSCRFPHFPQAK